MQPTRTADGDRAGAHVPALLVLPLVRAIAHSPTSGLLIGRDRAPRVVADNSNFLSGSCNDRRRRIALRRHSPAAHLAGRLASMAAAALNAALL